MLCLLPLVVFAQLIDLNLVNLTELKKLPITEQQAQDIYSYREYVSYFNSIYDLRKIPSIDQKTLDRLKPLVIVHIYRETDDATLRREEIMSMLDRYDSNEGASEGMADVWMDYLMTPQNVNRMHFDDLISLPNVSAVDAAGILTRRAAGDTIADTRDLRNTPGLSYYGYSNLRSFVYYREPPVKNRLFVDAQIQYFTRYLEEGPYDMLREAIIRNTSNGASGVVVPHIRNLSYWGYFHLDQISPDVMLKARMRYGNMLKSGWMYYSAKGETPTSFVQMQNGSATVNLKDGDKIWKDSKLYVGYENPEFPLINNSSLKVYLGNYRATYGEGLVMENTDYYTARKTGYGFGKRIIGITPDLSRTQEFALRGGAMEYKNPWFGISVFASHDKKDAVVYMERDSIVTATGTQYLETTHPRLDANGKYDVFSYITPSVRFDNEELSNAETFFNHELPSGDAFRTDYINLAPRTDFLDEKLWGTHLQVTPLIGTKLGFTTYTALYDNVNFKAPNGEALKQLLIRDSYDDPKFKYNDSEIGALYNTKTSTYDRDFRRVMGFDGVTVLGNTSIQGEYAELTVTGKDGKIGDDPKAMIMSAYTQFENLYLLTLYRNIDLDFDNPYSNFFGEHAKYDDTIFDKNIYALTNPLLSDLWQTSSQSQPEKGIYFETRYRFSNYYTVGRSYLDIWERMSDHRRSARFQSELEFRPLFQLGLRLRYKNQINRTDDFADRAVSKTDEYTMSARTFLSNRDYLEFEYRYNTVWGPPYTSLTNPAEPNPDPNVSNTYAAGMVLMKGDYIGVNYTHHFNENFYFSGSFIYWYGHGISHWDWEDMEIDFMGYKGCKSWVALHSQISQNLYLTLKYRNKSYMDKEIFIRNYNQPYPTNGNNYYQRVEHSENTIRLQLDYRF